MRSDGRRIVLSRIVSVDGVLSVEQGCVIWQNATGGIEVAGLWKDVLVSVPEDLSFQAKARDVSPLEWLRQRLARIPHIRMEVV